MTRDVPPSASALMSSLRGVGYSLEKVIGDIVDHSMTLGARQIDVALGWGVSDPVLTILDDGSGISEERLSTESSDRNLQEN